MRIERNAYAKINLFLDITGRRSDGYHTITGIMQSISLCDVVTVESDVVREGEGGISLTCSHPDLPQDHGNLGWRAAEAFLMAAAPVIGPASRVQVRIHIQKHIPCAAGLAGGSTDAAAVLHALNDSFVRPLAPAALAEVGLRLGADIPFCLTGGTMLTEGIGELLTPLSPLPDCYVVVACTGEGVLTKEAYAALGAQHGHFAPGAYLPHMDALAVMCRALTDQDLTAMCAQAYNIFETVVLPRHASATALRDRMQQAGAFLSMMSGSGPSIFGIFPPTCQGEAQARTLLDQLKDAGVPAWLCTPVPMSRG